MKRSLLTLSVTILASILAPSAHADELRLNQTVPGSAAGYYDHHESIVLSDGFWAQAGADVTATIHQTAGFYLDKSPLDVKNNQYTANEGRTFLVAGCVPHKLKVMFVGSHWIACNDLDEAKDKVLESKFVSCLDFYENGVLEGFSLKEVNNRTWQSFRFSCRNLQPDGTMGSEIQKTDFLFHFEKDGKLYETTVQRNHLPFGILEMYNQLQLLPRENLLQIAIEHAAATAIHDAGVKGAKLDDFNFSDKVPNAFGLGGLIGTSHWQCPPGMVMTGAAIGHNPDKKGNDTRPIYILAECRKLLLNPSR